MSSFGRASLKDVVAMLKACAPGFKLERKKHLIWVFYNGIIFHGLPTGEHGKANPGIQVGTIKHMIRFLEIDHECAKKHLAILQ